MRVIDGCANCQRLLQLYAEAANDFRARSQELGRAAISAEFDMYADLLQRADHARNRCRELRTLLNLHRNEEHSQYL